ncbi:nucleotidyltransferase domain-containing protein [Salinicola sp. V024]|uniref:nucleotidyltransferase domain-containing protein n=1 Tax=Salinicola TaxID=404432 RepID=UPI000DA1466C|nr:nucleotidyltransferase domain-containing protein [Salinicola halophyticus]
MRLSDREIGAIKNAVRDVVGRDAQVRLFGSRTDDAAKGGDIDLMITVDRAIENPAWAIARVEAKIIRQLGERKIDVVLNAPNMTKALIHRIAQDKGMLL